MTEKETGNQTRQMLKAIIILPGNVLITIPGLIVYFSKFALITPGQTAAFILMLLCFAGGLFLTVWSLKLFADAGNGSPAPWNPVGKLIITGPYAYMRNPMLTGVFLILLGEALLFQSRALGWYWLIFVMINAFYFPLSEEKGLLKRFGKEYETYKNNVPRFIPRLSPYKKK